MPNVGAERRPTVAFADIANLGWTAGAHYYGNLFRALRQLDAARRPRVVVVVPPYKRDAGYDTYRTLADDVIEIPEAPPMGFLRYQLRRAEHRLGRLAGRESDFERLLRANGVDALFACWQEWGPGFGIPVLGWIPYFQHKHYPEYFPAEENRQRDELFDRIAANCPRIVLSSEDARRDYERFIPQFADKARVLRFVAQVPDGIYDGDPADVCAAYHLPERFLYLPNQFWVHKNHAVVVDALAELRSRRPDITVVCTGNPSDNRDTLHFARLLERVSSQGVRDSFIVLGWVPQGRIFELMRQSVAVLQPSLFEGWSTTVEEAKSLGKSVILSDIAIHREQDPPGARYFDPHDPHALAGCMVEAYDTRSPGPDHALEASARAALAERTREYGETFMDIVLEVVAEGASRPGS